MPTPLEILINPISLVIIAMYLGLMLWEFAFPARKLPTVRFWKIKGLTFFSIYFFLSSYLPLLIDPFLAEFRLIDLTGIGTAGGIIVGLLAYELGLYAWHRLMHGNNLLWRTFHQMHHSAERMDTYGAFFLSPLDMIGFTVLGSLVFTLFIGLTPGAITAVLLLTNFLAIFQHANIKTPAWLGYLVQRPESHTVHHAMGLHKYNYCDLPLFDLLFGTFRNPDGYEHDTGIFPGSSDKILDMLLFRDITPGRKNKRHEQLHIEELKKQPAE